MRIPPLSQVCSGLLCSALILTTGCATNSASQSLASLSITATPSAVTVGGTVSLKATAHLTDGTTQDVTSSTLWTVSNPALATLANGVLTSKAAGTVNVAAAYVMAVSANSVSASGSSAHAADPELLCADHDQRSGLWNRTRVRIGVRIGNDDASHHLAHTGAHRLRNSLEQHAAQCLIQHARHLHLFAGCRNSAGDGRTDAQRDFHAKRHPDLLDRHRYRATHRHPGRSRHHLGALATVQTGTALAAPSSMRPPAFQERSLITRPQGPCYQSASRIYRSLSYLRMWSTTQLRRRRTHSRLCLPHPAISPVPPSGSGTTTRNTRIFHRNNYLSELSPATPDNAARKMYFTYSGHGGEIYHLSFAKDTKAHNFIYDTYIYLTDPSQIMNVEMDMNQVTSDGRTVILATQCAGSSGTFEYTTISNGGTHWHPSNIKCDPRKWSANAWHHVQIATHRDDSGNVTYDWVNIDGVSTNFQNASGPSAEPLGWAGGDLLLNFQLDGANSSGTVTPTSIK